MNVLVVNAGSSSLKLHVLDGADGTLTATQLERWAGEADTDSLADFIASAGQVDAVGHRIVHGGHRFTGPARLDDATTAELAALTALAPLHQPRSLAGVRAVHTVLPDVPAVGCFDTAFHATLPEPAATYPLPAEWRERWGLRRYGFHGLSHAYAARRAAELVDRPLERLRVLSCHLGAGASACAVVDGRSVDTTMGFTPLEGLVMATRSGSVDPGLLIWLQQHGGLGTADLADGLEHHSGLAGLAGRGEAAGSGDMRDVRAAMQAGDAGAALAFQVYIHRLRAGIAAMAAAMQGLDVLVFTGGIGEHQPAVRSAAAAGLDFLGVQLNEHANAAATADADIGDRVAATRAVVVTAREDLEITRQVRATLG
ncbi:MAG TPA: acetate/propionate family kinase [Actinomycetes bacterium]|nr:acetate/propionate family kinase [Actinomycetes bacterium]